MRDALPYLLAALWSLPFLIAAVAAYKYRRRLHKRSSWQRLDNVVAIRPEEERLQVEIKHRPGGGWVSGGRPNSRGWNRI